MDPDDFSIEVDVAVPYLWWGLSCFRRAGRPAPVLAHDLGRLRSHLEVRTSSVARPDAVPEIDQAPVSADVNGDGLKTVLPATGNEWLALVYDAGGRIGH